MSRDEDGLLRVRQDCVIPVSELEWRFGPSGGPGGQHANRASTKAEVIFDVETSPSLTRTERSRIHGRLGSTVTVAADDHRSQTRNRDLALDRLRSKLGEALAEPKKRRRTKPSRSGAGRKRVEQKRQRSQTKKLRGRVARDDY